MPSKVFISYRRDDSAGSAGRVHDRLEREFGADLLFMDVDAIPLGRDFTKVLRDEVAKCDVLLALIGPNWLNVRDEEGKRRLDNPADYLRIEIATALQRDIPVIPILLDGARMPKAGQLPKDLEQLSVRQGTDIRHASFRSDMDNLIRGLKNLPGQIEPSNWLLGLPDAETSMPRPAASEEDRIGRIKVDAMFIQGAPQGWFTPGAGKTEWFKDHEHGPDMVVVPAGEFLMGSTDVAGEQPVHKVVISSPFAVGKFAVTFAEWDACVADGGCNGYKPDDNEWRRHRRPVINVSWHDAKLYIDWLNAKTGKAYRLLSEAEREYVTRAGTTTPFWWGPEITPKQANYNGTHTYNGSTEGEYRGKTVPVDSFEPNPWGLFNVHGNVFEWCEDIWHDTYSYAPTDGSAWLQGVDDHRRVVRGGSWLSYPQGLRASSRYWDFTGYRSANFGFRLARTLNP
jgi:formylglycine-generating enzyme required for sulfatase activity